MSPFGPFYCVFRWDLSQLENSEPKTSDQAQVRYAKESEFSTVAELWYNGLSREDGAPLADYLRRWTPNSAAKWFLDSQKRLGARMIVAEKDEKIVGLSGLLLEKEVRNRQNVHRNRRGLRAKAMRDWFNSTLPNSAGL